MSAVQIDCICFEKGRERTILQLCILHQNNCSDDSTEVTEGVTSTPEIFGNIVLSLPFSQQIQFTLIVSVANLN